MISMAGNADGLPDTNGGAGDALFGGRQARHARQKQSRDSGMPVDIHACFQETEQSNLNKSDESLVADN
jgi:hypothetical protein